MGGGGYTHHLFIFSTLFLFFPFVDLNMHTEDTICKSDVFGCCQNYLAGGTQTKLNGRLCLITTTQQ